MEENDVELEPGPVGELEYISNKMREVNIKELSRGFVVKVGCQSYAFTKKSEMIGKLIEYINNPAETECKWNNGNLFE
jgi:hypothetical protein